MLLLLHTGFTWSGTGGAVSGAVVLALISGGYGRLLYQRIPKTPHGRFLTPDEMKEERVRLAEEVCRVAACSPAQADIWLGQPIRTDHPSPLRAMALSLWYRLRRQSQASRLSNMLSDAGLKRGRNRELVRLLLADQRLQTQMAMRSPFARMFQALALGARPSGDSRRCPGPLPGPAGLVRIRLIAGHERRRTGLPRRVLPSASPVPATRGEGSGRATRWDSARRRHSSDRWGPCPDVRVPG